MTRLRNPLLALIAVLGLAGCSDREPMNVLILFLDDLGYGDIAANRPASDPAPRPATPVLDRFKRQSLSFSRHYTESTCSPSRAALLSGRYPSRFGFNADGRGIAPEITTLAEAFQQNGYLTHFLGKWHLGHTTELAFPHNQGFTTWNGFLNQWMLRSQYNATSNNLEQPTYLDPWLQNQEGEFQQHRGHLTDILTDQAISFLNQRSGSRSPWFMQLSYFAPHEPVTASEPFTNNYDDNETGRYLALLEQLDSNFGRLLSALDESGAADNTLVVIVSDNGGTEQRYPSNSPYFGVKTTYTEGGVRTPLMIRWPDGSYEGKDYAHAVSLMDLYPTLMNAAGVAMPEDELDGVNLLPYLESATAVSRSLYWESEAADDYFYSVLDESHRYRYSDNLVGYDVVMDLETDPSGSAASIITDDAVQRRLQAEYFSWREEVHRIATDFTEQGANGIGVLRGDSLQRSPGFGSFTFGIGARLNPDASAEAVQAIAYQEDLLKLEVQHGRLNVRVQDLDLSAPFPMDSQCHSIVLSARFEAKISWLLSDDTMSSPVQLFIDNELVAEAVDTRVLPKAADLLSPTYIGSTGPGTEESEFDGTLSRPVVLNHRVWADPRGNQAAVSSLSGEFCP